MTDRRLVLLARAVFALAVIFYVGTAAIALAAFESPTLAADAAFVTGTMVFAVAGFVILRRQPRNAVGWVLLGVGFSWQFSSVLDTYAMWGYADPTSAPGYGAAAAVASSFWVPGIAPLGTFVILLFPDGRLPTPRWRAWGWLCGVVLVAVWLLIIVAPGPIESDLAIVNPLGIEALAPYTSALMALVLGIPVCIFGCAVALVRRYRASAGVERLQLKWLAYGGSVTAAVYIAAMVISVPYNWGSTAPTWVSILQNVSLAAFLLIPLAVGIAILRYRLYDIDRLINRTLVYGAVSAFLIAVYVASVFGLSGAVRAVTGQAQNNLAVAASTLAVAALFRPARARVQQFIDRRFYRRKYDAMRTVEGFAAGLRQETDLAALSGQLRGVVTETVQPARVSLWIAAGK